MTYAQVLESIICICGIVLCKMSIRESNDNRKPVRYINNDHH